MLIKEIKVIRKLTWRDYLLILCSIIILSLVILVIVFASKNKLQTEFKYAAVIDCGSSGSRIHLFQYKYVEGSEYLPTVDRVRHEGQPVIRRVETGLSSFADTPDAAVENLKSLIDQVYEFLPENKVKDTDLYILATAGMRLIPENKQKAIIDAIKEKLPNKIRLKMKNVEIITGEREGVFMWISLNYVLENFQKLCGDTISVIEMGGASTQVAFESNVDIRNTVEFKYICKKDGDVKIHHIYSTTFLGLGVNSALKYYREKEFTTGVATNDACLAKQCKATVDDKTYTGTGMANQCFTKVEDHFRTKFNTGDIKTNYDKMISRIQEENRAHQRSIYALASFHFAFKDFIHYSGPLLADLYWKRIEEFCQTDCSVHQTNMNKNLYNTKNTKYLNLQCFRVPFMRYMIEKLFPFQNTQPLINFSDHRGEALDYTLGALVFILAEP